MKPFFAILSFLVFSFPLLGQENYTVENRVLESGSLIKKYNFFFEINDPVVLDFADSTVILLNESKTIEKEIHYNDKEEVPKTKIMYYQTGENDTIIKYYSENMLESIYTTQYDEHDRVKYYSMKNWDEYAGDFSEFEMFYAYHDSITETGRIEIQMITKTGWDGEIIPDNRVLNEYDGKNRIVKKTVELRPRNRGDQITRYFYDQNDKLTDITVDGMGSIFTEKNAVKVCEKEGINPDDVLTFEDIISFIKQGIMQNGETLKSGECERVISKWEWDGGHVELIIRSMAPYDYSSGTATWVVGRKFP